MSIDRRFIRVTNQWSEAFTPGDNDQYVVNISGYTVKMFLSATQINPSTITKEFFTIGGNITQIKVDKGMYAYLTAAVADGEDTAVIADYEKMPLTDIEYLQDELEKGLNQIMRLSDRVTKTELKLVRNKINLKRFTREWLHALASTDKYLADSSAQILSLMERVYTVEGTLNDLRADMEYHDKVEYAGMVRTVSSQANSTNLAITNMNQRISDIWGRLYVAERWMIEHGSKYDALKTAVDNIIENGTGNSGTDSSIVDAMEAIVDRMNVVEAGLRDANTEIDNLKNNPNNINDLRATVNALDANFAALNNAIINLSYSYSEEEIEELFSMMIDSVPADMVETVTAVKDDLIRLSKNTDILEAIEDGSIVTTGNNYILGDLSVSDLDNIGATTEAANNPRADEATVDQTQLDS